MAGSGEAGHQGLIARFIVEEAKPAAEVGVEFRGAGMGAQMMPLEVPAVLHLVGDEHQSHVDDGPEFPFWKVVVPARVEGSPLLLEIDSGGSSSGVQLDSATGALLQKRVPVKEAGGKSLGIAGEFTTTSLDNAEIEVGALKFVRDIDLLPGTSSDGCFYDGVLGMDVLATCQIYLTDSRATLSCGSDT